MEPDESDNFSEMPETDNVETSEHDNPEPLEEIDPETDNEDFTEEEGTEDEVEEAISEEAPEEEADSNPADADEQAAVTAADDAVVQMDDGTTVTVKELRLGNMRQADFSRKSQENANHRKELGTYAQRLKQQNDAFVEAVSALIPEAPPIELATTNPTKYWQEKAYHEEAVKKVESLMAVGQEAETVAQEMTQADQQKLVQEENLKLASLFPETGSKAGREKFFRDGQKAAEFVGFSTQELNGTMDHRLFALAHWAQRGIQAEQVKTKAKAKAQKAPPSSPVRPGNSGKQKTNRDAVKRLMQDDSIENAVAALSE